MKRLTLLAALFLAGCTVGQPKPECTVTTHEGRVVDVFQVLGSAPNRQFHVGMPFASGTIGEYSIKSTTCK